MTSQILITSLTFPLIGLPVGKKVCLQQEICKEFEINTLCDLYLSVMTASIYNTWYMVHILEKKIQMHMEQ